jgi:hypothetical protein
VAQEKNRITAIKGKNACFMTNSSAETGQNLMFSPTSTGGGIPDETD